MSKTNFDFNKALEQLQAGQGLTGKDGRFSHPHLKQFVNRTSGGVATKSATLPFAR